MYTQLYSYIINNRLIIGQFHSSVAELFLPMTITVQRILTETASSLSIYCLGPALGLISKGLTTLLQLITQFSVLPIFLSFFLSFFFTFFHLRVFLPLPIHFFCQLQNFLGVLVSHRPSCSITESLFITVQRSC